MTDSLRNDVIVTRDALDHILAKLALIKVPIDCLGELDVAYDSVRKLYAKLEGKL